MKALFRVGTSGYSYPDWKNGVFYPKGLAPTKWLEYYATQFDTVELNITFYRLPKLEVFKKWYQRAPRGFRFFLKGSRFITHVKRLKAPADPLKRFFKAAAPLKEKLAGVLWQLPPRFEADPARFEPFLKALRKHPAPRHIFEFRHESWFSKEIADLLRAFGAVYCRPDMPSFYAGLEVPDTGPLIYLRRHGTHYAGSYSEAEIREDAAQIRLWLELGKQVYLFYNNDIRGAAPRDAKRLKLAVDKGVMLKF